MAKSKGNVVEGMKKSEAMEALIKSGLGYAEAEAYWKEHGTKRGKAGFRAQYYEACLETKGGFDKDGFLAYAEKNGASDNDMKASAHYLAISALVERAKAL